MAKESNLMKMARQKHFKGIIKMVNVMVKERNFKMALQKKNKSGLRSVRRTGQRNDPSGRIGCPAGAVPVKREAKPCAGICWEVLSWKSVWERFYFMQERPDLSCLPRPARSAGSFSAGRGAGCCTALKQNTGKTGIAIKFFTHRKELSYEI